MYFFITPILLFFGGLKNFWSDRIILEDVTKLILYAKGI